MAENSKKDRSNSPDRLEVHKGEHRALALLRLLDRQPAGTTNEHIVSFRFDQIGLACSRADLRDCIERIEKLGLIKTEKVEDLVVIALLAKGEEFLQGRIDVDGILKPRPECPY